MSPTLDPTDLLRGFDAYAELSFRLEQYLNRILPWKEAWSRGEALGKGHRRALAAGDASFAQQRLAEITGWLGTPWPEQQVDEALESAVETWAYLTSLLRVSTGRRSPDESLQPYPAFREYLSYNGRLNPQANRGIVLPSFDAPLDMPGGLVFIPQDPGCVRVIYKDLSGSVSAGLDLVDRMAVLFQAVAGGSDVEFVALDVPGRFRGFGIQYVDEFKLAERAGVHLARASDKVQQPFIVVAPELVAPLQVRDALVASSVFLPDDQRPYLMVVGSRLVDGPTGLPYNQAEVVDGTGDSLFTQRKNWPFRLPRNYVRDFALDSFGLDGDEVEAIQVPTPPEVTIADVGFARMAVLICEDLGHLEEKSLLDSLRRAGVTLLIVPVMSREIGDDWSQRLGDVARWAWDRKTFVVITNSRVLPDRRVPAAPASQRIGLIIRQPWGGLDGDPNESVPVATRDSSYAGFTGTRKLSP